MKALNVIIYPAISFSQLLSLISVTTAD